MSDKRHASDMIHFFVSELTAALVAETGIASDRFHLGKIILKSMKDNPDMVLQIDSRTDESETSGQCLKRTIKCAVALKNMGVNKGDVMVLMAPNHLDLAIPFYAALALGIAVAPTDRLLGIDELRDNFETTNPTIIFCQSEDIKAIKAALNSLASDAKIVTFDRGDHDLCFADLMDSVNDEDINKFRATDFDPAETYSILIPTSGTTGAPKSAATTHKNFATTLPYVWSRYTNFPPLQSALILSPLQWLSALIIYISSPYMRFTRIQSSANTTKDHVYHMINKYKPKYMLLSPTLMTTIMKPGDRDLCDFSCFDIISLAGSAVHIDLIDEVKKVTPKTEVINLYGLTEATSIVFIHGLSSPPWSCGKPVQCFQLKMVDIETGNVVDKPNENGELWIKGPGVFKGYYNNPEANKGAFEDGWFKTGDILYRDESWNFYFVERIKLLLKYRNHQISPVELEAGILQHPGVLDVAVTGIPDMECGDLPVACIVPRPGLKPTAQEIKDLVKGYMDINGKIYDVGTYIHNILNQITDEIIFFFEKFTDTKQLRGGVIFLSEIPMTASTKVHRRKLKEIVLSMYRE